MVTALVSHARDATFNLLRRLHGSHGKTRFALCGSAAVAVHGIPVMRPLGDVDIAAVEPIPSGASLRRALLEAGCEKLAPLKKFPGLIREGRVPFVLDGLTFELLCQHTRAAAALPPQAEAAKNVMKFTRESVRIIDGVPVLDIDAIVVWQALFDRPKDRMTIEELVKHKRFDGKPAIQDRDKVLDLVIANKSKHDDSVKFLQHMLWNPWHGCYR